MFGNGFIVQQDGTSYRMEILLWAKGEVKSDEILNAFEAAHPESGTVFKLIRNPNRRISNKRVESLFMRIVGA